jgi:hypothetical protein
VAPISKITVSPNKRLFALQCEDNSIKIFNSVDRQNALTIEGRGEKEGGKMRGEREEGGKGEGRREGGKRVEEEEREEGGKKKGREEAESGQREGRRRGEGRGKAKEERQKSGGGRHVFLFFSANRLF